MKKIYYEDILWRKYTKYASRAKSKLQEEMKNIDDFVLETSLPPRDTQAERHLNNKAF